VQRSQQRACPNLLAFQLSHANRTISQAEQNRVEGHKMHRIPTGQESPIRTTFHRDAISRIDRSPVLLVSASCHSSTKTHHVVVGLLLSLLLLLLSLLGLGGGTTSSGGGGRASTSTSGWDGSELLGSLRDELWVSSFSKYYMRTDLVELEAVFKTRPVKD
jgi:hypothetical protein